MANTTIENPEQLTQTVETKTEEPKKLPIKLPLSPFIIQTPDGDISECGVNAIEWELLNKLNALQADGKVHHDYHELPKDFDWKWVTNRGTLPKRIQAYYYKQYQVKLPVELVTSLGNLGRQHSSTSQTLVVDFTDDIDWQDGDFGDGGSCFWGEKSGAKLMIEKNGWAVRFYKARDGYTLDPEKPIQWNQIRGYARAWVADIGERLIVFNGYGESTLTFARILALKFSCSYRSIRLTNNGYDDGTLWINGAQGYIIGEHSKIESFTRHDLGWPDENDDRYVCEVCEERFDESDTRQAYTARGNEITTCADCSSECERCNEYYAYDLKRFGGSYYCRDCRETEVQESLDEAKATLSKAERKVEDLETQLQEAKEEAQEAQERVDELEEEVNA